LKESRPESSIIQAARRSKDPSNFTVLFEDSAALVGLAIAFLGVLLSHLLDSPYPDAIASILVGLVLATVAIVLIYETKMLIVGESADEDLRRSIRQLVESDPAVAKSGPLLTMQLRPEDVLLNFDVQFREGRSAEDLYHAIEGLKRRIREKHKEVRHIFLEIDRPGGAERAANGPAKSAAVPTAPVISRGIAG
jgi:divalent metal cation (Fe/Co/Zn/Cd) transporter